MKPTLEQLRVDLEIAQENYVESETARSREHWRKRCFELYEEIQGREEEE